MAARSEKEERLSLKRRAQKIGLPLSPRALAELRAMGLDPGKRNKKERVKGIDPVSGRPLIRKKTISAPDVINEAFDYTVPSSFSRGMRVELPDVTLLFLSGTASVNEKGETVHAGDLPAQCLRTFRNLTRLLASEGASWHDVIRTTCYIKNIKRDYGTFNKMRTMFMRSIGLDPLPASTGVQAELCRPELLVEIEAIAMIPRRSARKRRRTRH